MNQLISEFVRRNNIMEKEIVFVTHNTGKIKSAERYFKTFKIYNI